jgi:hypothetical protein
MFREFVTDIAPAVLLSIVLSIAGVIAAAELARVARSPSFSRPA